MSTGIRHFSAEFPESQVLRPTSAVFVYGDVRAQDAAIRVHDVIAEPGDESGAPTLGPGRNLDVVFFEQLMRRLSGHTPLRLLAENTLGTATDTVLWWTPAKRRTMYFSPWEKEGNAVLELHGKECWHPPLLWLAGPHWLHLYALPEDKRPSASTPLLRAPYWNINDQAQVCLGSMVRPKDTPDVQALWEVSFFESHFSHSNGIRAHSKHPMGFIGLWKELIETGKPFPTDLLYPIDKTLGRLVEGGRLA